MFIVFLSVAVFLALVQATIIALRVAAVSRIPSDQIPLAFCLFLFSFPMVLAWSTLIKWIALPVAVAACFLNALAVHVTGEGTFAFFYILFGGLYGLLSWFDRRNRSEILMDEVESEKNEIRKNQLDLDLRKIKEEVDASLAKYTTYYSLREVAERFATTLSLEKIADLVIQEVKNFIPKGDMYLLYLAQPPEMALSLIASHSAREEEKVKAKKSDLFDVAVVKDRKHLLVSDTRKEVFFDFKQVPALGAVRSIVVAPLVSEGRVVGTFRINAPEPNAFTIDDLRLLDFICVLASSAVANALLYERTEELAIRDSLTGLYVQRYFKERLKEEHKRALLTQCQLSLLMCDLDHFKNYNDSFGHAAGDMILVKVSRIVLGEVPEDGMVARYGGEELAILLPRVSKETAREVAERIRRRVESERMEVRREPTQITISIGVSTFPSDTLERDELIRKADQNLYTAKRMGRNRVVA